VLGPGSGGPETLPPFLRQFQALDCRSAAPSPGQLKALIAQVSGKEIVADRALRAFFPASDISSLSVTKEIKSIESLFSLGDRETAATMLGKLLEDLPRIPIDQRGQFGVFTLTRVGVALSPEQRDAVAKSVWGTSYYGEVAPIRVLQENLFAKTPD